MAPKPLGSGGGGGRRGLTFGQAMSRTWRQRAGLVPSETRVLPEGEKIAGLKAGDIAISDTATMGRGWAKHPLPDPYRDGDEYAFIGADPNDIYELQLGLVQAGVLGKRSFAAYTWDEATAGAMKKLMAGANRRGMAWQQYLSELIAGREAAGTGPGGIGGGGAERGNFELPVFTIANPDDLKSVFRATAQELMGFDPTDEELGSMVLAFQNIQTMKNQEALNFAQQTEAGKQAGLMGFGEPVTVTEAPSPNAFAERQIREKYGGQIFAYNFTRAMPAIEQFLKE